MSEPETVRLSLPVPPSPNRWASNPMMQHRQKRKYQRAAWLQAFNQTRPSMSPPECVEVNATLYLCRLRDGDNAVGSCKWALDALKQTQLGKHGKAPDLKWRERVAPLAGYFVDDDEPRLTLSVVQVKVSKRAEERLALEVVTLSRAS